MDYDSDDYDTYAEISDDIAEELQENNQLDCIFRFKQHISKEPEFYGIDNISSFSVLQILKDPKKTKLNKSFYLSEYQYELLEDICACVLNKTFTRGYYSAVANDIFNKIYV
tara:strand:- start:11 stop:346 length:336 start_codon:yes stop_codon:yes gene_type:complete